MLLNALKCTGQLTLPQPGINPIPNVNSAGTEKFIISQVCVSNTLLAIAEETGVLSPEHAKYGPACQGVTGTFHDKLPEPQMVLPPFLLRNFLS